jgi:hypothetical protein
MVIENNIDWVYLFYLSLCYVPLFLAYICFYSAIEEDSPSISMIKYTKLKGQCCFEDYKLIINNDLLIGSRLEAMIRDGFVEKKNEIYFLTNKGILWGKIFSSAASFFNFKYAG